MARSNMLAVRPTSSLSVFGRLGTQVASVDGKNLLPETYAERASKVGMTVFVVRAAMAGNNTTAEFIATDKDNKATEVKAEALAITRKYLAGLPKQGIAGIALVFWQGKYDFTETVGVCVIADSQAAESARYLKDITDQLTTAAIEQDEEYQAAKVASDAATLRLKAVDADTKRLHGLAVNIELRAKINAAHDAERRGDAAAMVSALSEVKGAAAEHIATRTTDAEAMAERIEAEAAAA